jgi:murein DD-endopeptidase MepM/ murein hydrolase activator NlpD
MVIKMLRLSNVFLSLAVFLFFQCVSAPPLSPTSSVVAPVVPVEPVIQFVPSQAIPGSLLVVSIKSSNKVPKFLKWANTSFPFYLFSSQKTEKEFEAIVGVPYASSVGPANMELVWDQGESSVVSFEILEPHYPSSKLRVDGRRVLPRASDLKRIQKEQVMISAIYKKLTGTKLWKGPFEMPIASSITSVFGVRRLYNDVLKSFHSGVDLRAAEGTSVRSPSFGRVVLASSLFYTGNTVMIDHGYGLITLYGHLSKIRVQVGDHVVPRALLGYSGKTGRVTGPHLHWGAVVCGIKINPCDLTKILR